MGLQRVGHDWVTFTFICITVTKVRKTNYAKDCRGYEKSGTRVPCKWECRWVQQSASVVTVKYECSLWPRNPILEHKPQKSLPETPKWSCTRIFMAAPPRELGTSWIPLLAGWTRVGEQAHPMEHGRAGRSPEQAAAESSARWMRARNNETHAASLHKPKMYKYRKQYYLLFGDADLNT